MLSMISKGFGKITPRNLLLSFICQNNRNLTKQNLSTKLRTENKQDFRDNVNLGNFGERKGKLCMIKQNSRK